MQFSACVPLVAAIEWSPTPRWHGSKRHEFLERVFLWAAMIGVYGYIRKIYALILLTQYFLRLPVLSGRCAFFGMCYVFLLPSLPVLPVAAFCVSPVLES